MTVWGTGELRGLGGGGAVGAGRRGATPLSGPGRGWLLRLAPSYGDAGGGLARRWEDDALPAARLDAEMGYGVAVHDANVAAAALTHGMSSPLGAALNPASG